jgi:hypothetical protein
VAPASRQCLASLNIGNTPIFSISDTGGTPVLPAGDGCGVAVQRVNDFVFQRFNTRLAFIG